MRRTIPGPLNLSLLAQSCQPSGMHATQQQQLADAHHALLQASAALLCVAAGTGEHWLESEAKRLQAAVAACAVEIAGLRARVQG